LLALAAASAGIADYFIPMLIGLGVVSAPLAGVYVVDFWDGQTSSGAPADSPAFRPRALATWALGSAVGLVETYSGGHALNTHPRHRFDPDHCHRSGADE